MEILIKKRYMAVCITLILCVFISSAIMIYYGKEKKRVSMEQAGYVAASEISKLQYAIDSRILNTEILRMIIVNGNGIVNDFDGIAEKLYSEDTSIRSLQLAPDGVVKYVYPLSGNEGAFVDLFHDENRKTEAEYARDTGKTTLAGPFKLYQGGLGVIARAPVYINDETGKKGFWGFSIIVLNVPEIFDKAELNNLSDQGYDYRIWRIHPDTGEKQTITEKITGGLYDPIEEAFTVPNGTWKLSIAPSAGWVSGKTLLADWGICFLISILVSVILYGFLIVEKQKRELTVLANTDPLTGLHNERCFTYFIKKQVYAANPFGLLYLDINKFKQVNDQYGHDVGDKLLIEVGNRIKHCIGPSNMAFRLGGDEFAVLICGRNTEAFYNSLKKQIKKELEMPFQVDSVILYPHASCGYARYPEDQEDVETLIKQADQRMYKEKNQDG